MLKLFIICNTIWKLFLICKSRGPPFDHVGGEVMDEVAALGS